MSGDAPQGVSASPFTLSSPSVFLALDIGNSATKLGLHDGSAWMRVERINHKGEDPSGPLLSSSHSQGRELGGEVMALLQNVSAEAAGIASVVPDLTVQASEAIREQLGIDSVVVSAALPLPFEMGYETPDTLGADRLAAAAAAWLRFGRSEPGRSEDRPVMVVDAGTAVATEVISADGVYLGGAIAPGPDAIRRALVRDTTQLHDIAWPDAPQAIGSSTHAAISAGMSIMFLHGVEGLLERSADQLEGNPFIVATGGWAEWLNSQIDAIDLVEPNLVLDGVRLLTS